MLVDEISFLICYLEFVGIFSVSQFLLGSETEKS